jgi:plasmid maintenance system antidote protein VapI
MTDVPLTREEWAKKTTNARRAARMRAAEERIRKIVDGAPPLTAEQRDRLALLLRGGAS